MRYTEFRKDTGDPSAFDFEGIKPRAIDSFLVGSLEVDVALLPRFYPKDSAIPEADIFSSTSFGKDPTTVYGTALGSFTAGIAYDRLQLTFSTPLAAIGFWVFDDGSKMDDVFDLTVWEADGEQDVSDLLDSGRFFGVEGFMGATSTQGITSIVIRARGIVGGKFVPSEAGFEIDNLRLAPMPASASTPEPFSVAVWGGLACLGGVAAYCRRSVA